jgi:hypothetical protein
MALLTTSQSSKQLKEMKQLLFSQYRRVQSKPCSYYDEMKRLDKEIMVAEKLEQFREQRAIINKH